MGKALGDFAMQAGQQVLGTGLGLLLEGHEDRRQIRQQGKLQDLQIQGNKEMTDYNTEKQRMKEMQMWKDTNYGPQMAMMKEAGLNPALMYGGSGGGGSTTGGGGMAGSVSGGEAPKGTGTATVMGMNMAQMGLLRAQKENIEADTANKKAEVPVKEGQVPKLAAETEGITLDNQLKSGKLQEEISIIKNRAIQSIDELIITQTQRKIGQETREAEINKVKAEAIGQVLENILTKARTGNVNAGTTNIRADTNLTNAKTVVEKEKLQVMVQELIMAWRQDGREGMKLSLMDNEQFQKYATDDSWDKILPIIEQAVDGILKKGVTKNVHVQNARNIQN